MQEETSWVSIMKERSQAFMGDKADKFAKEMYNFVACGLSLSAYDRKVQACQSAYEEPLLLQMATYSAQLMQGGPR